MMRRYVAAAVSDGRGHDANGNPNYATTMACVELVVFIAIIILAAIGREARGIEF